MADRWLGSMGIKILNTLGFAINPATEETVAQLTKPSDTQLVREQNLDSDGNINQSNHMKGYDYTNNMWKAVAVDPATGALEMMLSAPGYELTANKATNFSTVNHTLYPSVQAAKEYADSLVSTLLDYRGAYDASGNVFPSTGGSGTAGAILKGDSWVISVQGTLGGSLIHVGDMIIANTDTPGQTSGNWNTLNNNIAYTPENQDNKVTSISGASTDVQYPSAKLLYDQLALKQASGSYVTTDQSTPQTLGATGARLTKLWATDIECTNSIAGDITGSSASCTGNAATATVGSTVVTADTTDTSCYIGLFEDATGNQACKTDAGLTYNAGTAALSATTFIGALTGTASGNLVSGGALGTPSSGTLTSCTGLPIAGIVGDTSTALGVGSIEVGHASDTTITRSAAGVIAVESVVIPSISSTNTLTNKRITPRITTIVSHATPTVNTDDCDAVTITAQAEAITSMTTNLSGTPTNFQKLIFRIKDNGTARAITWGSSFEAKGVALPTTTVISKVLTTGFFYDTVTSKWSCVASVVEA